MADRTVDVAIIGAGTAGMAAYRRATEHTDNVLIIEAEHYGTTCARVGCMPSKLLIAAAEAAHAGVRAEPFGVRYRPADIDGPAVMARLKAERDRFVRHVVASVEEWPQAQRIKARAMFADDHTLVLSDGSQVRAEQIVIATGSRPDLPRAFESFGDRLITSDDVFDWDDLPKKLAVFGGGVIGLELGQALHRLGVEVTLFGKDGAVAQLSDPQVMDCARSLLSDDMRFLPDAEVKRMGRAGNSVEVEHELNGSVLSERFDWALVAVGRRPNIDGIGLENTSVERDEDGVPVYDRRSRRCGQTNIFIAGDASADPPLLHLAAVHGKVGGANAGCYPDLRQAKPLAPLTITFCDPQAMTVGETWRQLKERGAEFEAGAVDWSDQGRARVMMVNRGVLRVYGQRGSGKFLGAEMIGPRAEHLAHLLAWSLQADLTVSEMLQWPYYHPCLEEGLRTALRELEQALGLNRRELAPRSLDCGPGS